MVRSFVLRRTIPELFLLLATDCLTLHHWTDRILQIAEATEQESLNKLSETVKAKRLEEQQLTQSLNQLQNLRS